MGSKPKVVQQNPEADAQKAKDQATAEANSQAAVKRRGVNSTALGVQLEDIEQQPLGLGGNQQQKQKKTTLGG